MTIDQFNHQGWTPNMRCEYGGATYTIASVDFVKCLVGLKDPLYTDKIAQVRCENIVLTNEQVTNPFGESDSSYIENTPETDAMEKSPFQHAVTTPPPLFMSVDSDFARKLERQRNSANAQISQIFRDLGLPEGDMDALKNYRVANKKMWVETTKEHFYEALGAVPPIYRSHGAFLLGEPIDHRMCEVQNKVKATYQGYLEHGENYWKTSQPVTLDEFTELQDQRRKAAPKP